MDNRKNLSGSKRTHRLVCLDLDVLDRLLVRGTPDQSLNNILREMLGLPPVPRRGPRRTWGPRKKTKASA